MKEEAKIKKIGDVCEVISGQSPKSKFYNTNGNGLPFYQGKKDFTKKYLGKPKTWTTSITKEAKKEDLLISVRAPVGPINIATERICIGRGLTAIRATPLIDKFFLYYFFLKNEKEIKGNIGAVFNSLSKNQIKNILIPVPPLPEQRRIVALLDQAFEAVDQALENTEKNLLNTHELFKSFVNNIFANPGGGWEEKKLGDVCENLDSKRVPITKRDRQKGIYPYYGASGIVDYVNEYIFDEDLLLVSEDGANLLARTYPIAFSISGKSWVNNHAHVLKFENLSTQRFIEYFLNSIKLDDYVTGMAQPKLNQRMLNLITVPFPNAKIRNQVVNLFDTLSIGTRKLDGIYQKKITDLEELRQSLLHKAFAGKLVPRENIDILV